MKNKLFGVVENCLLRSKMVSVRQLCNYCEIFHPFRGEWSSTGTLTLDLMLMFNYLDPAFAKKKITQFYPLCCIDTTV